MKRLIWIIMAFVICISLCSCTSLSPSDTISYNDGASELYYNDRTYINYDNTNGKYHFYVEDEEWKKIATMPYGFFYVLGAVNVYYGNDVDNPDFIVLNRTDDFFVREDIVFDHNTELSLCDTEEAFRFKISEVTTGNVIEYEVGQEYQFTELCNFFVAFERYPYVEQWLTISESDGKLYLQDVYDSDYYEITDEFKEDIYRLGLDTFNYYYSGSK